VFIVDRAHNVGLIESKPQLPRQTYDHCARTTASDRMSSSLDYHNTVPPSSRSTDFRRPPASCDLPSASVCHNSAAASTSRSYSVEEDLRPNRNILSRHKSQTRVGSGSNWSSDGRCVGHSGPIRGDQGSSGPVRSNLSYENSTYSSSGLFHTAGYNNMLIIIRYKLLFWSAWRSAVLFENYCNEQTRCNAVLRVLKFFIL